MITLQEARDRNGAEVVYEPQHGAPESGVITSVSGQWVFVRYYRGGPGSKATSPADLTFLNGRKP